jgi:diguanylate cyclase (GGDEF)-like protein
MRRSSSDSHRAPRNRHDSATLRAVRPELVSEPPTRTRRVVVSEDTIASARAAAPSTPESSKMAIATPPEFQVPLAPRSDRTTLTVLNGVDAGRTYTVAASVTIGRDAAADICIDDGAVSRTHARLTQIAGGGFVLEDLRSTNGTFVGGLPVRKRTLCSGDRIHVGPHVALRFATTDETEDTLQRRLYEASTRDTLTGALNRAALMDRLTAEVAFARRNASTLWLLMLDIDRFKHVNDTHGHLVGDQLLRAVARRATQTIRVEDIFGRFGGEEFVVLARALDRIAASTLAERLRGELAKVGLRKGGDVVSATVSIGAASLAECKTADVGPLVGLADLRLYAAKATGRNRVCFEA